MSDVSYSAARTQTRVAEEKIREAIVRHKLKPGDPLPPTSVFVKQLGISRNSVREAIKTLEALGAITSRPGQGLFVGAFALRPLFEHLSYGIRIDFQRITDLLELRFYLDYGMVESVIRRRTPEQVVRIRDALAALEGAAREGQYSAEADREFHEAVNANVANPMIAEISALFWAVLDGVSEDAREAMALERPDPMGTVARHAAIVDAVAAGDVPLLRQAMLRHYASFEAPFGLPVLAEAYRHLDGPRQSSEGGAPPPT